MYLKMPTLTRPGPGYRASEIFDLEQMQPYTLQHMMDSFRRCTENIVIYLPRTSDMRQIAACQQADKPKSIVMHYCMNGASKVDH